MSCWHHIIPLASTNRFTPLVQDYVKEDPFFESLIVRFPKPENMQEAVEAKAKHAVNREVLVSVLKEQYDGLPRQEKVATNIEALLNANTFTVCTAHQPIVFTGPMYVIYKTVHAINLAKSLKQQFPEKEFVPVFYMGTEDHDMDEIGTCYVEGETLVWECQQQGASGRMTTNHMASLLQAYAKYWNSNLPYEKQWLDTVKSAYDGKKTLAEATRQILHFLFGETGLVVLDADHPELKKQFIPVMETELFGEASVYRLQNTLSALSARYGVQANPRAINLFYLNANGRVRIEKNQDEYTVVGTNIRWDVVALKSELYAHPERFSPNVILRPLYQETILPNVAFIGGGGELAYWLQLKANFDFFAVPYPPLFLRNSLLFIPASLNRRIQEKQWRFEELFMSLDAWLNMHLHDNESVLRWEEHKQSIQETMRDYVDTNGNQAPDYQATVQAHAAKLNRILDRISQKTKAYEKRRLDQQRERFLNIQSQLFPQGSLQERKEHGLILIKNFGEAWLNALLNVQNPYNQQFTIFGNE